MSFADCAAELMPEDKRRIRLGKLAWARAMIDARLDEYPGYLDHVLDISVVASVQRDLTECPVGRAHADRYRDLAARALSAALADVVDSECVRVEAPCGGGHIDIDLPFRLESLPSFPFVDWLSKSYDAESIVVEVKNWRTGARLEDVRQISGYLDTEEYGRLGVLVSRSGFTRPAMRALRTLLVQRRKFVFPLSHDDLVELLDQRTRGFAAVLTSLREKRTRLRQIA